MNPEELENINETPEEAQQQAQIEKKEQNAATNARVAKVAAKGVATAYGGAIGGKAVEIASKTRIGQDILDVGGKAIGGALNAIPGGDKAQEALNAADEAGLVDMADKAVDAVGGDPSAASSLEGAAGATDMLASGDSASSLSSGSDAASSLSPTSVPGMPKASKIMLVLIPIIVVLVVIIVITPSQMLAASDGDGSSNPNTAATAEDGINSSLLDTYPSLDSSNVLEGRALFEVLTPDQISSLTAFINVQINQNGRCTGRGVAAAGSALIYGLDQLGFRIPYYYGGGHGNNNGIDINWGKNIGPSKTTPNGNVNYFSGLDCSGFVSWSMNTAGVSGGTTAANHGSYGPEIAFEAVTPGDVFYNSGHVILVIENKGSHIQAAESTTGGVQFKTYTKDQIIKKKYKAVDMDAYYGGNCNHA